MSRSAWLFISVVSLLSIHASSVSSAQGASSCFREQGELEASGSPTDQYFGVTVSLSDDTALVGAFGDDDNGPNSGSAYVFVRAGSTWTFQTKLLPSDAAPEDHFGISVSLSGDTAVIGATGDDDNGAGSGSAYVFERAGTSWAQQAKLQAMDGPVYEYFAHPVAVIGDTSDNEDDPYSGAAYVFARYGTEWMLQAKLKASDGGDFYHLGWSVSVDAGTAIVGALQVNGAGSARVFSLPPQSGSVYCTCDAGPCGNADPGAGCANSSGQGAELTAHGSTLPDELNFIVRNGRPNQFALFLEGDDPTSMPFGDGWHRVGGTVIGFPSLPVQIDADGSIAFGPCYGDPTLSSITGVVPGSGNTKRYQFWYRDPGGPCGSNFNLSNGYEITW